MDLVGVVLCGLPIGEGLDDGRLEGPNEKAPTDQHESFLTPHTVQCPLKGAPNYIPPEYIPTAIPQPQH